tara:strand:+ start:465 stop:2429 length:1965 start_codon:yes stop_codon:yes gene_type:complete
MGAYENPRFFNAPNYMAGTQAFLTTFKKGFEEEFQKGQDLIEDRKEYEKGIYEKGEELKESLDAALGNTTDAKSKIQASLKQFYDEALAVDVPTKKGLGGLFVKAQERRLGDLDLIEAQNSFTDATTGINTAFNYVYDPETDIMENEDRGHEQYKIKKAIHDQIKKGTASTNFDYANGKFTGGITVKLKNDDTGEMEDRFITTAEMQGIFTASGKEQRDIIDAKHTETTEAIFNESQAEVNNIIERAKLGQSDRFVDASVEVEKIARRKLGIAEDGSLSQMSRKFINDEYNNHANINIDNKTSLMTKELGGLIKDPEEIQRIINEPFDIGIDTYIKRYGKENAVAIKNAVEKGKGEIVLASYMEEMKGRGLMDKSFDYRAPVDPNDGLGDDSNPIRDYAATRAGNIASITSNNMNIRINPMDYTGSVQGSDGRPNATSIDGLPIGKEVSPGVRVYENPEFNPNKPASEENPEKVFGSQATDAMRTSFIGKVIKISNTGKLQRVEDVFIDSDGNVKFDYESGTATRVVDGEKVTEDLLDTSTQFNIYEPSSMKNMYKAMMTDLSGEKSKVEADNLYNELISNAYLDRPEQFGSEKMNKWAKYIMDNNSVEKVIANPNFINWLVIQDNGADLADNHPFKNTYKQLKLNNYSKFQVN